MRALRYYGTKDLRLDFDAKEPECLPNQIKIKPAFTGICGTDLHEYNRMTYVPTKENPHPVTGECAPVGLGHEFSGTVVEVGSDSRDRDIQVGDKVVVLPTISCRSCPQCVQGLNNCCQSIGFIGLQGWGGGLSDYVSVDATAVYKLPSSVPLDVGGDGSFLLRF